MQPVYIQSIASIHPDPDITPSVGTIGESVFLSACEPDYKRIITQANLRRRMSRIIKMGVACGLECIGQTDTGQIDAIITATGLGCLADTEKFMNTIFDQKEQMLNPTAFIQSTFNTIGGQIALLLQIHAYNVTYVHRGLSFESALLDGMMHINEGKRKVLVGAVDELTPASHIIQSRLGLLRGTRAGEGARFFLLENEKTNRTCAELAGIDTFINPDNTSYIIQRVERFLQTCGLTPQDIDWFVTGKNGNTVQDAVYTTLENGLFASTLHGTFKEECGEFQTASSYAVWKVARALSEQKMEKVTHVLIYNHYQRVNHSLILIRKTV